MQNRIISLLIVLLSFTFSCTRTPADSDLPRDEAFDGNTPAAPSGLAAEALSGSEIRLTWMDNSSIEDGFYVEGGTFSGSRDSIHCLWGANITSFVDSHLLASTTYYYVVKVHVGDSVYSHFSSEISCSTF